MCVVELLDVDGDAWDRRDDRRAHRRIGDHAVALAVPLGGDRDYGGCQVAEQLVRIVRAHHGPWAWVRARRYHIAIIYIHMPALLERLRDHITRARLFPEPGIAL